MRLLAICLLCVLSIGGTTGTIRRYFLQAEERIWDYAPSQKNNITGKPISEDEQAKIYLQQGPNRIGRRYWKVMYLGYTDASFTTEIKKPDWQGILGPIFRVEVGDILIVVLKNIASIPVTVHLHGVRYTKANEGAWYPDNTTGADKMDDRVQPGDTYTYTVLLPPDQGPTDGDEDCIFRLYHSHHDSPRDGYTGLIGGMVVCKPGKLKENPKNEFILLYSVFDEGMSWLFDKNIQAFCTDPKTVKKDDKAFQLSNSMHAINGYMFGNLPGLSMCDNVEVKWYLTTIGSETDLHSARFLGNTVTQQHSRMDTVSLLPASMAEATMRPSNPGSWLLGCQVNEHFEGGMQGIYEVKNCSGKSRPPSNSTVRHYYIAATERTWDYAPTNTNQFTGQKLQTPPGTIGRAFQKVVYKGFVDGKFKKEKTRTKKELHLGLLGPLIRAKVGDVIKVTFWNNASFPCSIQSHGLSYAKSMEGVAYQTGRGNGSKSSIDYSRVAPGQTVTYVWEVTEGPTEDDPNCKGYLYYSSTNVTYDGNTGLYGPLLVCKCSEEHDETVHFFIMPAVIDENKSHLLDKNIQKFIGGPIDKKNASFTASNFMDSINGYIYANQPGLEMCAGDSVAWHLLGVGGGQNIHGIHFGGNPFQLDGATKAVAPITPHTGRTALMTPENEGVFSIECETAPHYKAGMRTRYKVKACGRRNTKPKISRTVVRYIAAVEIEWNYSPSRVWEREWHPNNSPGDTYLNKTRTTIGSTYLKIVYREYTDARFLIMKRRAEHEHHLGILGPLIQLEVNDNLIIIFKNKGRHPHSIYAHGLTSKDNETKATQPGQIQISRWYVPESSGPNKDEIACVTWPYYSKVDQVSDFYSGLFGIMVVCNKCRKPDVRLATFFSVMDENKSLYMDENIKRYAQHPEEVNKNDPNFVESNKMHAINGYVYGNALGLTMHVGDLVEWHIAAMGGGVDIHTFHIHGHSMNYTKGHHYQTDVFEFYPGVSITGSMIARSPGTWFFHCHVDKHIIAGMDAFYTVLN